MFTLKCNCKESVLVVCAPDILNYSKLDQIKTENLMSVLQMVHFTITSHMHDFILSIKL